MDRKKSGARPDNGQPEPDKRQRVADVACIAVTDSDRMMRVERLARAIWPEVYTPIIGPDQVHYMLTTLQNRAAFLAQIEAGMAYFLVTLKGTDVGYTGLVVSDERPGLMISKLYLAATVRGQGVGQQVLAFIESQARSRGPWQLWLTVNRHNDAAIGWYRRQGFYVVDRACKDIGGGFVMDDLIMARLLD